MSLQFESFRLYSDDFKVLATVVAGRGGLREESVGQDKGVRWGHGGGVSLLGEASCQKEEVYEI